jgi:hypothetical protein
MLPQAQLPFNLAIPQIHKTTRSCFFSGPVGKGDEKGERGVENGI